MVLSSIVTELAVGVGAPTGVIFIYMYCFFCDDDCVSD